jgi:uncharacterized lipoprotein YehR (DUF1307 family)
MRRMMVSHVQAVAALSLLAMLSGCNAQEHGSGRQSPDGTDIAATGIYNGQDTHGEGAGSVAERSRNEQMQK